MSALIFDATRDNQYCCKLSKEHTQGLNDCAFIRDEHLVTASDDKLVKVWSIAEQKVVQTFSGHGGFVSCLAVNPRSDLILSGGYDNRIKMWDMRTGSKWVRSIEAHAEAVTAVDFHSNGTEFVSSSHDG
jgi:COMPASS component SWD3